MKVNGDWRVGLLLVAAIFPAAFYLQRFSWFDVVIAILLPVAAVAQFFKWIKIARSMSNSLCKVLALGNGLALGGFFVTVPFRSAALLMFFNVLIVVLGYSLRRALINIERGQSVQEQIQGE